MPARRTVLGATGGDSGRDGSAAPPAPRPPSLRAHLAALVLAVRLPALAVGGATAWHLAESYRRAFEARLQDTSRALALYLDSAIEEHAAVGIVNLASALRNE